MPIYRHKISKIEISQEQIKEMINNYGVNAELKIGSLNYFDRLKLPEMTMKSYSASQIPLSDDFETIIKEKEFTRQEIELIYTCVSSLCMSLNVDSNTQSSLLNKLGEKMMEYKNR